VRAPRVDATAEALAALDADCWREAAIEVVPLAPAPVATLKRLSPVMARRVDYGAIRSLRAQAVHNGTHLALRVGWEAPEANTIGDLDQFADAVAVMFPMHPDAAASTMGAPGRPVNAWYWRAGDAAPFDVVAEGLGTSRRRPLGLTALTARSRHADGQWLVTLVRPLAVEAEAARFAPGARTRVAFSVWDGGRAERAGLKSSSVVFSELELEV